MVMIMLMYVSEGPTCMYVGVNKIDREICKCYATLQASSANAAQAAF